jgi:hypothetical protein
MTYACPTWDFEADTHLMKLQRPRIAWGIQYTIYLWLYNKIIQAASRSHTKPRKCKCSQYWIRRSPAQKVQEA